MIFAVSILLMIAGAIMLFIDVLVPFMIPVGTYEQLVSQLIGTVPIQLMGMVLFFVGLVVLAVRGIPLSMFMDLPNSKIVPLVHSRIADRDPDAQFLKGKRLDLETIKAKNKIFKDAGGGFRIMGHSCRRTYETIGFTVPDWLSSYFHEIKEAFMVKNSDEWRELSDALKGIKQPGNYLNELGIVEKTPSLEEQLKSIKVLEPVVNDPDKLSYLVGLGWRNLQKLELQLYDGICHNGDGVELFIDSATPNELDVLEHQTFLNDKDRDRNYADVSPVDWGKIGPWIIMIILIGVVAAIMLQGAFGG
jgi:hypothetical protein